MANFLMKIYYVVIIGFYISSAVSISDQYLVFNISVYTSTASGLNECSSGVIGKHGGQSAPLNDLLMNTVLCSLLNVMEGEN